MTRVPEDSLEGPRALGVGQVRVPISKLHGGCGEERWWGWWRADAVTQKEQVPCGLAQSGQRAAEPTVRGGGDETNF